MSYPEFRSGEILKDMRVEGAQSWANNRQMLSQSVEKESVSQSRYLSGWVRQVLARFLAWLGEQREAQSHPV
jgi:hypothetical protein